MQAAHDNLTNEDNVLTVQTTAHINESQVPDATTEIHLISQNPLNTIAARSVLEMGYTNMQVLQAIEKLRNLKIGMIYCHSLLIKTFRLSFKCTHGLNSDLSFSTEKLHIV